jgi:hypothetical protein
VKRLALTLVLLATVSTAVGVARATQQPPAPAPTEDRVGFPEGYRDWTVMYVLDRPDNRQVRVIYGNDKAAAAKLAEPFPYGSILVMETYGAVLDEQMNPVIGPDGRYMRGNLAGIFVMRKEPGFGEAYEQSRTGEWEYVAFRPDGSYSSPPQNTASCAICHFDTRGTNDWTYRTPLYFNQASGALPQGTLLNYSFVPDTIRAKAGQTITWYNIDTAFHTVTAADGSWDSGKMLYGFSFSQKFDAPGTYEFKCNFHQRMTGRVVVE